MALSESAQRMLIFSAFALGTITSETLAPLIGLSQDQFAKEFNDWITIMPRFVLEKWHGVHYDEMAEFYKNHPEYIVKSLSMDIVKDLDEIIEEAPVDFLGTGSDSKWADKCEKEWREHIAKLREKLVTLS